MIMPVIPIVRKRPSQWIGSLIIAAWILPNTMVSGIFSIIATYPSG
ncbi:uncharacterized protein METZ01_LOCUS295783, partial [marine metagenome]